MIEKNNVNLNSNKHLTKMKTLLKIKQLIFITIVLFGTLSTSYAQKIIDFYNPEEVVGARDLFRIPTYIIARKQKKFWEIREKIF